MTRNLKKKFKNILNEFFFVHPSIGYFCIMNYDQAMMRFFKLPMDKKNKNKKEKMLALPQK